MTSLQLYTISSADFSVHLKLGNYRPGFLNGSIYQHAPIFWSKLFFYDVPAENGRNWSSRIVLLNGPDELKDYACETRIGVEPCTGQIMLDFPSSPVGLHSLTLVPGTLASACRQICTFLPQKRIHQRSIFTTKTFTADLALLTGT